MARPTPASSGNGARRAGQRSERRRFWNYPRPGLGAVHRWLPSWRFLVSSAFAGLFLVLGLGVAAYATIQIPSPSDDTRYETTKVFYADNDDGTPGPLMGTYPGVNREIVDYTTLPEHVGKAVVASEDQSFFTNPGVDLKGIGRALWNNLRGGPRQGGSTLTQQYVERYYMGTTTDYVGKAQEALLAVKIGRTQSKEEILGRYLNTIYFGRGAYGIQAAAQAYFGVDAATLTVEQSALLAGIIPSPNNWDPAVSPDRAQARFDRTLDAMVEQGWLDATTRAALVMPATIVETPSDTYAGPTGYLLKMVLSELGTALDLSEDEVMRGGFTITTTIKQPVQAEAERAAAELISGQLSDGSLPSERLKVAIATVSPADGAIVALYGGADFLTDQVNRATKDAIQAGSTFKPFTLVAALEQGIALSTTYSGRSPLALDGWDSASGTVSNFGGTSYGRIDLVQATANSVNSVYAQLNLQVGPAASAQVATRAGITTAVEENAANVLGTSAVHPLDMAAAYATFAANGVRNTPFLVRTATNPDGSTAYTGGSPGTNEFAADVMADTSYALQQVVQSGSGKKWVKPLGVPIAGKTGTTTDNKAAWFMGYTPTLSTAVALSQVGEDGKAWDSITPFGGVDQVTGATWPAALWASYMKPVLALPAYGTDVQFPPRANVGATPSASAAPTPTPTPTAEQTQAPTEATVPGNLTGRLEADATGALQAVGLVPLVVSESSDEVAVGRVIRTDPGSGAVVAPGSSVTLVVSTGPAPVATPEPVPTTGGPSVAPAAPAAG